MILYVTRINKVNGEYVVEEFQELLTGQVIFINNYIQNKYRQPETVLLSDGSFLTKKAAISMINSKYENIIYYEGIAPIKGVYRCIKNGIEYIGFTFDDEHKYWAPKSYVYKEKPYYKRKYLNALKSKKVIIVEDF